MVQYLSTVKILDQPSQLKRKHEINKVARFSKNCILKFADPSQTSLENFLSD